MFSSIARLSAVSVVLMLTQSAFCITWNAAAGGSFQNSANWAGVVPGPADTALFDVGNVIYTVSFAGGPTNNRLIIGRDDINFNLSGFAYTLTFPTSPSIVVGEIGSDNAVLTLNNGTLAGVDATLGQNLNSVGVMNVPVGATLPLSGQLLVGDAGTGTLNVTGGTISSNSATLASQAGSSGSVTLNGPTAQWLNTIATSMSAGTSSLTVQSGASFTTASLTIGSTFSSIADVLVDGPTSQIAVAGQLKMSSLGGQSLLTVSNGGSLSTGAGIIGNVGVGADAQVFVTGAGSTWTSSGKITVGSRGDAPGGFMRVDNGAVVTSASAAIGLIADGQGAAEVAGPGSQWNIIGDLAIGQGTASLTILNGGSVSNNNVNIGTGGGIGFRPIDILVSGPGSSWVSGGAVTGGNGASITIQNGGQVASDSANINSNLLLDGVGSVWQTTNNFTFGGSAPSGTVSNGATLTSNGGNLGSGTLTVSNATWNNTGTLTIENSAPSNLRIGTGGLVSNLDAILANTAGTNGSAFVEGPGSHWQITGDLTVGNAADNGFGSGGDARMEVRGGGLVSNTNAFVARVATGTGTVILENPGTLWDIAGNLALGGDMTTAGGTADLTIAAGATVQVTGSTRLHSGSSVKLFGGTLSVPDHNALNIDNPSDFQFTFGTIRFQNNSTLSLSNIQTLLGTTSTLGPAKTIEVGGIATLNTSLILDGGTLSVGQLQGFNAPTFLNGTLNLTNDSLAVGPAGLFGSTLTLQSNRSLSVGNIVTVDPTGLLTIDQTAMTAGTLNNNGEVVIHGASAFLNGGTFNNFGRLSGGGRIGMSILNSATGRILVATGDHLVADGIQNSNAGRIDLAGGTIEFVNATQNLAGGLIAGHGSIISRTAFVNDGSMAFSGVTDIIGDITNNPTGLILVTGGGPTIFYDNLTHNGEIRTSLGATSVYLGAVTGPGVFTGGGANRFEGDFTPGASPGNIPFGGDVAFTPSASLGIELAGAGGVPGVDFDALNVTGNVTLDGTLNISTFGGYTPQPGMTFNIITYGGSLAGSFSNVVNSTGLNGLILNVTSDANSVNLTLNALAGDLNLDGFVGIDDLNIVLVNWNQTVSPGIWQQGDPTGEGFVGVDDLNIVLVNWNNGTPPSAVANIPEPGTAVLLGMGGLLMFRRRPAC